MMVNASNKNIKTAFAFLIALAAWLTLVYSSLWSAVELWIGNEIYNHCMIVIPASIYLIYEKRLKLDWSQAKMSWLALIAFVAQLMLFVLGAAADIQVFQHIAIFSMLPTLVWIFIGNKLAWDLKFPLAFVLFAVPVGEELIPFLQEITADMSVYLLQLTGIPLFRSGLFIEIPQGKFLVAEACSGVSFLIASIVLGNLYAYMNLVSWQRRLFFVGLSIVFPILANSVRVYGIIYIGYSSDMQYAVGADHLIYGWFFFAFVLVCLFLLGELIRRNESRKLKRLANNTVESSVAIDTSKAQPSIQYSVTGFKPVVVTVLLVSLMLSSVQTFRMSTGIAPASGSMNVDLSAFEEVEHSHKVQWIPRYVGKSDEKLYHLRTRNFDFDVYYAEYDGAGGELVSSLNKLYEQDRWTLVEKNSKIVNKIAVQQEYITTSVGVEKRILYWYVVGDEIVSSYKGVKISQLIQKLKGIQVPSAVIAVAIDITPDEPSRAVELEQVAAQVMEAINN
jgi:exosortase A